MSHRVAMTRRATVPALATIGAFAFVSSSALAATTRVVARGATRTANPCTSTTPCDYYWAITNSSSGDGMPSTASMTCLRSRRPAAVLAGRFWGPSGVR